MTSETRLCDEMDKNAEGGRQLRTTPATGGGRQSRTTPTTGGSPIKNDTCQSLQWNKRPPQRTPERQKTPPTGRHPAELLPPRNQRPLHHPDRQNLLPLSQRTVGEGPPVGISLRQQRLLTTLFRTYAVRQLSNNARC